MVVILDASTSVTPENWSKVLNATQQLIYSMNINGGYARVGIVTFGSEASVAFYLNSFNNNVDVLYNVSHIQYTYGQTNTAAALWLTRTKMFTRENGDRPYVPNIAVIVTDGNSNLNVERTIPEANLARDVGIELFAIGIGFADTEELRAITGSEEKTYSVEKFDDLERLMGTIYIDFCPGKTK